MTGVCAEESPLVPLLETLEDSSVSRTEQTDAYLALANRLSAEEGQKFTGLIGNQFTRLYKVLKVHISVEDSELNNAALQALGFCVFNTHIASGLSVAEIQELLSSLNHIAIETSDKNTCTRALWVISKQNFPSDEVGKAVPCILFTLETILNKEDVQSLTVEYEALNVVIRLLEQTPTQMGVEAVRWAKLIIPLVVHTAYKVRLRGATALELGMPLLLLKQHEVAAITEQLMTTKIISELQKLFSTKNETFVLKLWPLFVKLLGKSLHRSGSFINSLLQLEELGFRSGSPAIKKIAFIAWKGLIDNFALNPDILSSSKRLKLLMQPLSSIHVRTESLALTKLEVWWYLLMRLGPQLSVNFEQVCAPLIQSTLNVDCPAVPQGTPRGGANQSLSTPVLKTGSFPFSTAATPRMNLNSSAAGAPVIPSIQLLGIEMLLHFLLGPEVLTFAKQNKLVLSLEPLQQPLISSASFFCKHANTILNAIQDGFIAVGKDALDAMLNIIWKDVIAFVKAAVESGNRRERQGSEVLTLLLRTLKNIIMSNALPVQKTLNFLEATIKGLPQKVLGSPAYQVANMDLLNGTPALFLVQLFFHDTLLEHCVKEERFFINLETLVRCVLSGPTSPLTFSESVLGVLSQSAKLLENKEYLWRMWSIVVNPLTEWINQTNEVNQGDALEHNFSAVHSALTLPVIHIFPVHGFPQSTMKSLLRTWSELYRAFARCSDLVSTTEENVCCEELCAKMLHGIEDESLISLSLLDDIIQCITVVVECVNFSPYSTKFQPKTKAPHTPTDWSKRKREPLGNLTSLLKLLVKLVNSFHALSSKVTQSESPTSALVHVGSSIIGILSSIVSHISLTSAIRALFAILVPPLTVFYERNSKSVDDKVYSSLGSKSEKLLGDFLHCLQSRYTGAYDSELLDDLSCLLCVTFPHKNKQIRNHTIQFWNATFAKATVLRYHEALRPILSHIKQKVPLLLPGFENFEVVESSSGPYSDTRLYGLLMQATSHVIDAKSDVPSVSPWPHLDTMFKCVSFNVNKYKFLCLLCAPKPKEVSAFMNSPSNLRKHVERIHPNQMKQYEKLIASRKRKNKCEESQVNKVQRTLQSQSFSISGTQAITQAALDNLILDFIIRDMQPFSTTESPAFRDLIMGILPNRTVMSRKTAVQRIEDRFQEMKMNLIQELENQQFVATTADCWSIHHRSFLGVTVHWIDQMTMQRKSAALACRRLKGSHTYDVVAAALESIHSEFHLQDKIIKTTIDNWSNFRKAFQQFSKYQQHADEISSNDDSVDEMEFHDLHDILSAAGNFNLPPHQRCACYSLNLVATCDATEAESDLAYKKLYCSTFAKCQALWKKQSQSVLSAEVIEQAFGLQFVTPNQTRWNSTYNSIEWLNRLITEKGMDVMNSVCKQLDVVEFRCSEIIFIAEYVSVMKPLMQALDILRCETKAFMAYLVPTLVLLKEKLKAFEKNTLQTCQPLIRGLLSGIQKRFEEQLMDEELIAAAILHPKFKTVWIKDPRQKSLGMDLLLKKTQSKSSVTVKTTAHVTSAPTQVDMSDDFFTFNTADTNTTSGESILSAYMNRVNSVSELVGYPVLKDIFSELNTALPASAACERLFSVAGWFSPKRGKMTDNHVEHQLLLGLNSAFDKNSNKKD